MGWAIGFDTTHNRDIGYGVPAVCDHPDCSAEIDRGLSYVCGGEPYGGEHGCGLYFCEKHLTGSKYPEGSDPDEDDEPLDGVYCERCTENKDPFDVKPDTEKWTAFKLLHSSWQPWRQEHTEEVEAMKQTIQHDPFAVYFVDDSTYIAARCLADAVYHFHKDAGASHAVDDLVEGAECGKGSDRFHDEDGTDVMSIAERAQQMLSAGEALPFIVAYDRNLV